MMDWEKDVNGFFQEFCDWFIVDQSILQLEFKNLHLFISKFLDVDIRAHHLGFLINIIHLKIIGLLIIIKNVDSSQAFQILKNNAFLVQAHIWPSPMESYDDGRYHILKPETGWIIFDSLLPSPIADENLVQKFECLSGLWHLKDFTQQLHKLTKKLTEAHLI